MASRASMPEQANVDCFDAYYDKPSWWFRLRYGTEIKRKTCLHLLRAAGRSLSGQRVLDIGFGNGATLFSFDRSCEIYGLEISTSALEAVGRHPAAKQYRHHGFHRVSGAALPFGDQAMDIVIASHVIEHVPNDEALMREIRRVLSPRGVAVILVPINETYDDPKHVRRYTPERLASLAKRCQLDVVLEFQNELLFYAVERFYCEGYNTRWRVLGPVIAAMFNVPAALLPFGMQRALDRILESIGLRPRQAGLVVTPRQRSEEQRQGS